MQDQNFQLLLNGVPFLVKATPFDFNTETRYTVSYNGSDEFVFAYDTTVGRYTALGDESATIPDDLEEAIAEKLLSLSVA